MSPAAAATRPPRRSGPSPSSWTSDEWIICWQQRLHEGLRNFYMAGRTLSSNESYAIAVARAGYLSVALSAEGCIELLPVVWRAINNYGIKVNYRTYDSSELNRRRRQPSGVRGNAFAVVGRRGEHFGRAKRPGRALMPTPSDVAVASGP
ncbi:hypothetical protein ACFRCI_45940 [Streptomyces sp. NPDC056638]|uniref:hypothetical protein n=1 Tax=Streptomyces sp. NPDC056638 TaxID=3345887 RepID=UPI0036B630E6